MLCKKCGAIVPEGVQYCQCCGNDMFAQPTVSTEIEEEPAAVMNEQADMAENEEPTVACNNQTTDQTAVGGYVPAEVVSQSAQKKSKGPLICIVLLAVIAVAAIVMCVLLATDIVDFKNKDNDTVNPTDEQMTEAVKEKIDYDFETAVEIGDIKVTNAQFDYYYSMSYQYFQQMEMSYQQQGYSLGFPLDKSPDEVSSGQKDANGNELYYDKVIAEYAANLAFQYAAFYNEAEAAGYELTVDEQKQIEEAVASIRELADEQGCALDDFIKSYYSEGLDEKGLRELFEIELIAARYNEDLEAKAYESVTDEKVEAEYKANTAEYASYTGNSVDVRHCLIMFDSETPTDDHKKAAYAEAEKARNEFLSAGGTEEAFIGIVTEYNDDTASTASGGLYQNVTATSNYVDNFKNWAIDPARKAGDCEIVETEYGYHIMYFVKSNGPSWKAVVREKLQQEAYSDAFEALMGEGGKYEMVKNEDVIEKCAEKFCDKLKEKLAEQNNR